MRDDTVTVEFGEGAVRRRWTHDVPAGTSSSGRRTAALLARTLERWLRFVDTPASRQIARHMRDIRDMIDAMPE